MGIVVESGMFPGNYYENTITNTDFPQNISALSETEQEQASNNIMNAIFDVLTWNWIKNFFQPYYSLDSSIKSFVDHLILLLNGLNVIITGSAFIEMIRNRVDVLGG
ncbi:MAG: hypothetical protein DRN33_06365 [Thermoplasmata archaeon]|nr:MAG: hypothetical protein DRN33_06365 [Thermoplasmata archaeon]